MDIGKIKSAPALRLLLVLLLNGGKLVLPFVDAVKQYGFHSPSSWVKGREELISLGVLRETRSQRRLEFELLHPSPSIALPVTIERPTPPVEPVELPKEYSFEARAEAIDEMVEEGKVNAQAKRKAQVELLTEAYAKLFPEHHSKHPISAESVKLWLREQPSTVKVLSMLQSASTREIASPPGYITAALRKDKERQQTAPPAQQSSGVVRGNQTYYSSEEEASEHWETPPELLRAIELRKRGGLKGRKTRVQEALDGYNS